MVDPENGEVKEAFYGIGTKYSVTLNPPDDHQYFNSGNRFSKFYDFVQKMLLTMGGRYVFFIELSEPRGFHPQGKFKGPRLHLHGIVYYEDKQQLRQFLCSGYYGLTRWTATDIDTISDMTVWKQYIQKQSIVPKRYRKVTNIYGKHRNAIIE